MTPEQDAERLAAIRAEVATWPRLTTERKAELRRLLLPAADRLRAAQANERRTA